MALAHRIDVHHHPSPPSYLDARESGNRANPPRMTWTVEKSLDMMDRGGIAASMLSLPHSVSIWPDKGEQGRRLAREWNEFMAKLAADHPGRFGVFVRCLKVLARSELFPKPEALNCLLVILSPA